MFIECPFCPTKLSVDPAGIPEMGREKRCVNCFNRFRVVRTPDEVVLQFQQSGGSERTVDDGRSDASLQGNLSGLSTAVEEKRYAIAQDDDEPSDGFEAGGGSGVFADFFEADKPVETQAEDTLESTAPEMEIPAEQNLQLDEVFGQLSGEDTFSPRDTEPAKQPRLLTSKDLMDRKAKDYKRNFRLDAGQAGRSSGIPRPRDLIDLVDRVVSNLTAFDAVLLVVFLIVVIGAVMGFTSAGFFGMNWFAGETIEDPAAANKQKEAHLSRAEVYKLIELISEPTGDGKARKKAGDGTLLPSGDYEGLFVEEVSVAIRSTPTGARVWRGDEMIGVTPLLLRLAKDAAVKLSLRVEKEGFQPRNLSFDQGDSQKFDLTLSSSRSAPKRPSSGKKARKKSGKKTPKGKPSTTPTEDDFIIY
jgi:hypothetical protein